MPHPILKILNERRQGKVVGIPSYCTANRKVIETILRDAAKHGRTVLIEATANQVDQFGGYTGMKPKNYVRFIEEIAAQTGCDMRQILLGGDHLGPLTFCKEPEAAAMDKAEALVRAYVAAGFTKIHLDTSMKVADDPAHWTNGSVQDAALGCAEQQKKNLHATVLSIPKRCIRSM